MTERRFGGLSLFDPNGGRKYLDAAERRRFKQALASTTSKDRLFCSLLYWSGSRVSEALALTPAAIDLDSGVATFETLKRRRKGLMRQVPLPTSLVRELDRTFSLRERQRDPYLSGQRLWSWSRVTAWRHVKAVMLAAQVTKSAAMPKGLRHSFGVNGFQNSVPQIEKVLAHALHENGRRKVHALVFVGDALEEDPPVLFSIARQLGQHGVPAFLFQEGDHPNVSRVFAEIARLTKGAHCRFTPGSAEELAELLRAVAVYAAGGRIALLASKTAAAAKLLLQLPPR